MTISNALRTEAWADASDLPLVLLVLEHADLPDPIRVVNNTEDVTSNGELFVAFPFELQLPDAREDAPPRARLRIDNVSREIGQAIRLISTPVSVTIQVVRQDDPDFVEVEFAGMKLRNVKFDALQVEGDLAFEALDREPYPAFSYTPGAYPGLV